MNLPTTKLERTKTTHEKNKRNVVRTHYLYFLKLFFTQLMFLGPEIPSQQGPGSVHYSDTHITLPPDLNAINISSLFSPQSSNEDSNINTRTESTEHGNTSAERSLKC